MALSCATTKVMTASVKTNTIPVQGAEDAYRTELQVSYATAKKKDKLRYSRISRLYRNFRDYKLPKLHCLAYWLLFFL